MEPKNREQRRREKFGHTGGATKEPWPQSQANPAFSHTGSPDEATDEPATKDAVPDETKPGSDRATKGNEPVIDRKGIQSAGNAKV